MTHNTKPNRDIAANNPRYNISVFYPDDSSYYTTECFFNVCVEADHTLRLKWLTDNAGVPNVSSKKDILVATLDADKWYGVTVRVGDFAAATSVDVCDIAAGTVVTYTVAAIVSINKHQYYGSGWGTGEPRRQGFRISGPHNQAVNNNFNSWSPTTHWAWLAFTTGDGYSGPWAQWNRKISDSEVALLMQSIYDTGTFRAVPRGISEIMKHGPQLYIPFDEYPGNIPRVTKQGPRVALQPYGSAFATEQGGAFSIRRRRAVRYGEGSRIQPATCFGPHAFTLVAFFYQPVTGGVGPLFDIVQFSDQPNGDWTGLSTYHCLYMAVESLGRPRVYWRNNSAGYNDNYFGAGSDLQNVGHHMVAFVFDVYYGLKVSAYVDGAFIANVAVSQQQLSCHVTNIAANAYPSAGLMFNAGPQLSASPTYSAGAYNVSGIGQVRSTLCLTDFAAYAGCLDQAAITEMYNAYVIALGPDSHE